MNLTVEQINRWIEHYEWSPGTYLIRLSEGDTMPGSDDGSRTIGGPATAMLAIYRDGGWYAYPQTAWTPEDIVR